MPVGEGSIVEAVGGYARMSAVRVSPTLAVLVMVGNPVAGVLGGGEAAATAPVAALVSCSSLPASSVKDTLTLMALPASVAARV